MSKPHEYVLFEIAAEVETPTAPDGSKRGELIREAARIVAEIEEMDRKTANENRADKPGAS